jgi:hypothetical protein
VKNYSVKQYQEKDYANWNTFIGQSQKRYLFFHSILWNTTKIDEDFDDFEDDKLVALCLQTVEMRFFRIKDLWGLVVFS